MASSKLVGKICLRRAFLAGVQVLVSLVYFLGGSSGAADDPARVGRWSPVRSWPGPTEHAFLLPTGNVMFYPGNGAVQLWDPATDKMMIVRTQSFRYYNPPYRYHCSGHAFLGDGKLLVAGGMKRTEGSPFAMTFDSFTGIWTRLPNMNDGRYYPTVTTLSTGDALVLSGTKYQPTATEFFPNRLPQIFEREKGRWRDLTGALVDLYYYPYCFVAPNDKVFFAGPGSDSKYLDTSGTGSWTPVARQNVRSRYYGSAVMYDEGKVLMMGGDNPPNATAEVIDLTSQQPTWRFVGSMATPRRLIDATILPDGQVLVTGGSSGFGDDPMQPALAAESWDPNTESWTSLASAAVHRGLHSAALLLPDGRVLKSGGEFSPRTAEIYSPPYLFQGPRPVIKSVPPTVTHNQEFYLETLDSAGITQVTLLRLGAVTHDFNQNQRINKLVFRQVQGGIMIKAPATGALCPPGHYMLFILDKNGVPSVAKIIRVQGPNQSLSFPSNTTQFGRWQRR